MVQTLVDLINTNSEANNASVSLRPFFNMYRNPNISEVELRDDIEANLYCSEDYPEFCLDKRSYGSLE